MNADENRKTGSVVKLPGFPDWEKPCMAGILIFLRSSAFICGKKFRRMDPGQGDTGASYSGTLARRLNKYAASCFASGFGTTS